MENKRPVIILKKAAGHGGHHGGAWKVAYADFVTAMMALFIVLWLMNSSKQVQEAVGGYFKDPTRHVKKSRLQHDGSGRKLHADPRQHAEAQRAVAERDAALPGTQPDPPGNNLCRRCTRDWTLSPDSAVVATISTGNDLRSPHNSIPSAASIRRIRALRASSPSSRCPSTRRRN